MARVICPLCYLDYDDLYRRTGCPHEEFAMRCASYRVVEGVFVHLVCTTVEQQDAFDAAPTLEAVLALGATAPAPLETLEFPPGRMVLRDGGVAIVDRPSRSGGVCGR